MRCDPCYVCVCSLASVYELELISHRLQVTGWETFYRNYSYRNWKIGIMDFMVSRSNVVCPFVLEN